MLYCRQFIDITQVGDGVGSVLGDGYDKSEQYGYVPFSPFQPTFVNNIIRQIPANLRFLTFSVLQWPGQEGRQSS